MLDELVFVTSNEGKAREASVFLGRPVSARAVDLPEIQAVDFETVVRDKALRAAEEVGAPVLVEDSGLYVAAWNGYPGALTKWITQFIDDEALARMLDSFPDRRAEAVSALAVARPGSEDVLVAVGRVAGTIASVPRGANGFGWDVLFVPAGESRTFAEMSLEEKNTVSHRARAFAELRRRLA